MSSLSSVDHAETDQVTDASAAVPGAEKRCWLFSLVVSASFLLGCTVIKGCDECVSARLLINSKFKLGGEYQCFWAGVVTYLVMIVRPSNKIDKWWICISCCAFSSVRYISSLRSSSSRLMSITPFLTLLLLISCSA